MRTVPDPLSILADAIADELWAEIEGERTERIGVCASLGPAPADMVKTRARGGSPVGLRGGSSGLVGGNGSFKRA